MHVVSLHFFPSFGKAIELGHFRFNPDSSLNIILQLEFGCDFRHIHICPYISSRSYARWNGHVIVRILKLGCRK